MPTNEVDKNAVAVVCANSRRHGWPYATTIFIITSMFLFLPHCVSDIFATKKGVNHKCEYRLEISSNFRFHGPEKAIKLAIK